MNSTSTLTPEQCEQIKAQAQAGIRQIDELDARLERILKSLEGQQ